MRIARAIDRFLAQKQVEHDWTERTIESYFRVLIRLLDDDDEVKLQAFEGRAGTDRLRVLIARRWGRTSPGRRANVISVFHTFFGWAEEEGFIDDDPSRKVKRPPRRKPDVYRPPAADVVLCYRVLSLHERAPWILAHRLGLRNSTVVSTRWHQLDLTHGYVIVKVKGGHWIKLPIAPDALAALQAAYRELEPEPDDYVFTVEQHRFSGNRRLTYRRDTKRAASSKAFCEMVKRVGKRVGVREFGPHALRHAFAVEFLRDSERDVMSLQQLMGHARLETTRQYLADLQFDDLQGALERASERRTREPDRAPHPAVADLRKAADRFWQRVEQSEDCWLWKGSTDGYGYGWFHVGGRNRRAHQVAFALEHGRWPRELVLHSCDTPGCVRPDHLYEGTFRDNMRDRAERGRNTAEAWAEMDTPEMPRYPYQGGRHPLYGDVASVASEGGEDRPHRRLPRKAADGPGRSRTSGGGRSASDAETPRADDPSEPPLEAPKGGH